MNGPKTGNSNGRFSYGLAVTAGKDEDGSTSGGFTNQAFQRDSANLNEVQLGLKSKRAQPGASGSAGGSNSGSANGGERTSQNSTVDNNQNKLSERMSDNSASDDGDVQKFEWDLFKIVDHGDTSLEPSTCWNVMRKIVRALTIVLGFFLLWGSLVVSKGSVFIITSAINGLLPNASANYTDADEDTLNYLSCTNRKLVLWLWSLLGVVCIPQLLVICKCLWKIIGLKVPTFRGRQFLLVALATETLHGVGLLMLLIEVLPGVDAVHMLAILTGIGIFPAFLRVVTSVPNTERCSVIKRILDGVCLSLLCITLFADFLFELLMEEPRFDTGRFGFHISIVLVSARWWPNYFTASTNLCQPLVRWVAYPTKGLKSASYKTVIKSSNHLEQLIIALWKVIIYFTFTMVFGGHRAQLGMDAFFNLSAPNSDVCSRSEEGWRGPLVVLAIQISVGLIGYYTAVHACKVRIQRIAFSLPLLLATPMCLLIAYVLAGNPTEVGRLYAELGVPVPVWVPHESQQALVISCLSVWWFAQMWISRSVWTPVVHKIASVERLFCLPVFDSEVLEQSLLFNRRDDVEFPVTDGFGVMKMSSRLSTASTFGDDGIKDACLVIDPESKEQRVKRHPAQTFIYMCATMWHETEEEMDQILTSIFKMDVDHHKRKLAREFFSTTHDPDYYDFEGHIFMDDAFTPHLPGESDFELGSYAKQLVQVIPKSATKVSGDEIETFEPPVRTLTPYGGRLTWTLTGGNKLVAHFKDKALIRNKKRWSQIMYMYYFMGHHVISNPLYTEKEKPIMAANTYILALDGDTGFEPEALILLVDLMKSNKDVGAACGRIHPIGSGPIVWYQRFEYAVSHWLQKATEHILGCVLCSPGCFSLFRAQAIMDDNVMRKYATVASEAKDYLQYDQGEDRWLCTLLLQQGWRVEYNAASDAHTFAPEGFNEFYNQRRRWGPSTMANILDLIMDFKNVIKKNQYMSTLYMIYQVVIFGSSILGPGTIFLMVTGALSLVLQGDTDLAFLIMIIPVVLYVAVSLLAKKDLQLKVAMLLSTAYAIVMCIVLVSIILEISQNACSPTAIFFYTVGGVFVGAAMLHPQEFWCLPSGLIYYLLIPCMYMLQIIFSFVNLNDVSWGTREVVQEKTQAELVVESQESKKKKEKLSISGIINNFLQKSGDGAEEGTTVSCGGACKIVCCPTPQKPIQDTLYLSLIDKMESLQKMAGDIDSKVSRSSGGLGRNGQLSDENPSTEDDDEEDIRGKPRPIVPKRTTRVGFHVPDASERGPEAGSQAPRLPKWMNEEDTMDGDVELLEDEEERFWVNCIETYLKPLNHDAKKQNEVKAQLLELRNTVTFGFLLINSIFITVMFILQTKKNEYKNLTFEWPLDCSGNGTAKAQDLQIEPIGFVFLVFFLFVIFLQVIGMLVHRLGTFWHIMASTVLQFAQVKDPTSEKKKEFKEAKDIIDIIYKNKGADDDDASTVSNNVAKLVSEARRSTVKVSKGQHVAEQLRELKREGSEVINHPLLRAMSVSKRRNTMNWLKKNQELDKNIERRLTMGRPTLQQKEATIEKRLGTKQPRKSMFRYDRRGEAGPASSKGGDQDGSGAGRAGPEWRAHMEGLRRQGRKSDEAVQPLPGGAHSGGSESSSDDQYMYID